MPVILPEEQAEQWIKDDLSIEQISALARFQLPTEQLEFHTIRKDFRQLEEPREVFLYEELPPIM
jgi:putative SOS response-associated peptidase YedK